MSSGSILPTFGAAPPNIRRAVIPRELQPDLPSAADALRKRPEPIVQEEEQAASDAGDQPAFGRPISVVGATGLRQEENDDSAETPPPVRRQAAQGPSEATRRIERAIEAAAAPDEEVNAQGLTEEEQAYVRELQAIDREVRAHEAAHAAVGGGLAGRPTYEYVTGPDGIRYAVSGRVQIDTGAVTGDPEATIRKLETVRRAALAPSKPSGQDRAVAAQAEAGIREAQAEINERRTEEVQGQPDEAGFRENDGEDASGIEPPSISDQISNRRPGEKGPAPSFATNLVAQEAFSQAALNQAALFGEQNPGQPRSAIDLLA